ncbi:MAG TPA: sodium:proton antiporter [Gammaproteobacteria bacterium]|nr:sodium:proton antiporter [Gammaproteobacteria bacterium]
MTVPNAFLFFSALLLLSALLEPLANRVRIPFSIVLVITGFAGSEIATKQLGIDTGIRWENFHSIIFFLILPALVFHAAINIAPGALRRNIIVILLLAIPMMLISTALIAVMVYFGIDHPAGFPWIAALLTGTLLSATDPAAVISLLQRAGAPERLSLLLEGESLFNDATAIVLFSIIIAMALPGSESPGTWSDAVPQFLRVFFGGLVFGSFTGLAAHFLIRLSGSTNSIVLLTVICAYGTYTIAELQLHVSGVMAVLAAGLMISCLDKHTGRNNDSQVTGFWGFLTWLAEALIFLLAGVSITLNMFTEQWLAMLTGIVAVIIARLVVVFSGFPLINRLPGVMPLPQRQQLALVWGGVRGTVTLALALSLPLSLGYWYTVQSIAYGVVLFTLFFQATSMGLVIGKRKPGGGVD